MTENNLIAGVVVRNSEGQYLLVQEGEGKAIGLWNFPAGHVDDGESAQAAALREGREETGFEFELIDEEPLLTDDHNENNLIKQAYRARVVGGSLSLAPEIKDGRWLTSEEIEDLYKNGKLRSIWVLNSIKKAEHAYPRH
jgi:ADP-ribose pyrophosphatase YjhB (NUDIX family)